jgi:alpha-methylacyl-CoA racemase
MPLTGLHVVSLAINLPGPVAAARFVGLGAEVTTVLPPSGDPLQHVAPDWFEELHDGQRLVTLDLKSDRGIADLHAILEGADVLLTSSRPAALARLGLNPETVAARHPRLCQVAIVGHSGAEGDRAGHDLTYQADAGLLRPPAMPSTLIADLAGSERAVTEALAAVRQRDRTGIGAAREVALADAAQAFAEPVRRGLTTPDGVLGGGLPTYALYATSDGHVALAALEWHFAERVGAALGVELTESALRAAFAQEPTAHWVALAGEHDLPLAAVRRDVTA